MQGHGVRVHLGSRQSQQGDRPQLTFERLLLVTTCKETGLGAEDRDYCPVTGKKAAGGIISGAAWRWWEVFEPGLS